MRSLGWSLILATGIWLGGCGDGDAALSVGDGGQDAALDMNNGSETGLADSLPADSRVTSDGGRAAIWPADATRLIANNHGGGFAPTPPPGSACALGESHYAMTVADRKLTWQLCQGATAQASLAYVDGERILTPAELDGVVKLLQNLTVAQSSGCGADKPVLDMKIATPAGETVYLDSFYQCNKQGIYVDGMDPVFSALRQLVR